MPRDQRAKPPPSSGYAPNGRPSHLDRGELNPTPYHFRGAPFRGQEHAGLPIPGSCGLPFAPMIPFSWYIGGRRPAPFHPPEAFGGWSTNSLVPSSWIRGGTPSTLPFSPNAVATWEPQLGGLISTVAAAGESADCDSGNAVRGQFSDMPRSSRVPPYLEWRSPRIPALPRMANHFV